MTKSVLPSLPAITIALAALFPAASHAQVALAAFVPAASHAQAATISGTYRVYSSGICMGAPADANGNSRLTTSITPNGMPAVSSSVETNFSISTSNYTLIINPVLGTASSTDVRQEVMHPDNIPGQFWALQQRQLHATFTVDKASDTIVFTSFTAEFTRGDGATRVLTDSGRRWATFDRGDTLVLVTPDAPIITKGVTTPPGGSPGTDYSVCVRTAFSAQRISRRF